MHSFSSITTVLSKKYPGVAFQIRTLNMIQRAIRDAGIADHRLEYSRLSAERGALNDSLLGKEGTVEEREKRFDALPQADRLKIIDLNNQAELIHQRFIAPATIKAAFAGITGLEIDGDVPDAEKLIRDAPDELLQEIYDACLDGSGLTDGEAKN